jgi:hypothetical protein
VGGWLTPHTGYFTPGKETRYPLCRRPVWTGAGNYASTGIQSPDRPASSVVAIPTELSSPVIFIIIIIIVIIIALQLGFSIVRFTYSDSHIATWRFGHTASIRHVMFASLWQTFWIWSKLLVRGGFVEGNKTNENFKFADGSIQLL